MSGQRPAGEAPQTGRAGTEDSARQDGTPGRAGTAAENGAGAGWRPAEPRAWRPPPTPVFLLIVVAAATAAFVALVALQHWVMGRTYVISPLATEAPTAGFATPSPRVSLTPTVVPEATAAAAITAVLPVGDPLEAEISDAYVEYWRVYTEALYTLDTSKLPSVAAGDELQRINSRIDSLRQQGEAIFVNVEHVTHVVHVTGAESDIALRDQFTDRSYAVDPTTKKPIPPASGSGKTDVQIANGIKEYVLYIQEF